MPHYLSWWEKSVILRPFDYLVLGAGIIGKQIAIKIKTQYPNARIGLIDRSPVSYGASTRNAGFACFGSVSEILDDFNRSPREQVIKLAVKRYRGIQKLINEFGADNIDFGASGSHEIFTNKQDMDFAMAEYQNINQLLLEAEGLENVYKPVGTQSMKMNCLPMALFNPYEGMINSGKLNETISDKAHRSGIIPLYGLNITEYYQAGIGYRLISDNGMELECGQLIIANNAFAKSFLPFEDIEPARGQIIITKPLNDVPFKGIFHTDKGYIYFRNVDDRVLIGGGRNQFYQQEQTYDMQGNDNVKQYLEKYLREVVLPGVKFETDMHWSGIMAMGKEKLPIVKRVDKHLCICVRMSGMGVALGPVLSDEVLALFN